MRIGLTYDLQTDPADVRQAEFDPPTTIDALTQALQTLGHEVVPLEGAGALWRDPARFKEAELVFNIAEGSHGRCREAWVPTLLELYGVPYVGSDPLALALGLDKLMSKRLAVAEGISTPRWVSVDSPDELPGDLPLAFPVMVKPRWEGSGRGIDAGAVVHSHHALKERVRWLVERGTQALLVEEFIAYGELTVLVIGNHPAVAYPAIQRPLDPRTRLSTHVVRPAPVRGECPLVLDRVLEDHARRTALAMFAVIGCQDMARVDLRVDEAGGVSFLEINPLPSFDPSGSLGLLAEYLGITYSEVVGRILSAARERLDGWSARRPALTERRHEPV